MRKHIGISAIALAAALAAAPAGAVSLNLGGGDAPLVDLSTSTSEPAVDVNLGNDTGATIDLNSNGDSPAASIDLDSGTDAGGATDGLGDLLDLGSGDTDATIDLNGGGDPNDVVVDLGNDDDSDVILDIFGNPIGDDDTLLGLGEGNLVDLGGTDDQINVDLLDGGEDSVLVDLFGNGADAVVDLDGLSDEELVVDILDMEAPAPATRIGLPDVGLGDTGVGDVGVVDLGEVLGGDVIPDLFGDGGNVDLLDLGNLPDIDIGDVGDIGDIGGIGDPAGLPDLGAPQIELPDLGLGGADGNDGADGDDGGTTVVIVNPGDNAPGFNPGAPDNGVASNTSGSTTVINGTNRVTARTVQQTAVRTATNTKCFTPNDQQIATLVSRRTYSQGSVAAWRNAGTVTLVPVRLCPEARVKVSQVTYGNANMALLRTGISGSPAITPEAQRHRSRRRRRAGRRQQERSVDGLRLLGGHRLRST